jgi:hypothetical protein
LNGNGRRERRAVRRTASASRDGPSSRAGDPSPEPHLALALAAVLARVVVIREAVEDGNLDRAVAALDRLELDLIVLGEWTA